MMLVRGMGDGEGIRGGRERQEAHTCCPQSADKYHCTGNRSGWSDGSALTSNMCQAMKIMYLGVSHDRLPHHPIPSHPVRSQVDNFIHADLHPGNILVRMRQSRLPTATATTGPRGNLKLVMKR